MNTDNGNKQLWVDPKLTAFGDVEKLTLANNKVYGSADGFFFQGTSVKTSG